VAEKRGVSVSKRVSSTSDVRLSTANTWSTRRSTPYREKRLAEYKIYIYIFLKTKATGM
jgi:hypothetical protein